MASEVTSNVFEPFEECRTAFPVHTFTKLILTGDSGAGKTTITERHRPSAVLQALSIKLSQ